MHLILCWGIESGNPRDGRFPAVFRSKAPACREARDVEVPQKAPEAAVWHWNVVQ